MKIINSLPLLMVLLSLTTSAVYATEIGVAATVEGSRISETQLQQAVDNYLQGKGPGFDAIRDSDRFNEIRAKVLDVLIGQELLWQAASRDHTIADDTEVDQTFKQYKSQFDDDMTFDLKLQEGGYTQKTFYEDLRRRISTQRWIDKFVKAGLEVSVDEIHAFYVGNGQEFTRPEEIRARHIPIKLESGASDEDRVSARRLLASIAQEIDNGGDFAALAKQKSQGPSAPGEVSEIVETRFGLHLIQLLDRKPPVQVEEKDVSEKIRAYLMQQKYSQGVEDAVAKLKAEALIE
jgi:peptidyl-prolyl cis-trans isomerase C